MKTHTDEHLCSELVQLTEKQISTLEKRMFGGITEAEQNEYDDRQERIRDLFAELYHLDAHHKDIAA
jgi:hypothetical protein